MNFEPLLGRGTVDQRINSHSNYENNCYPAAADISQFVSLTLWLMSEKLHGIVFDIVLTLEFIRYSLITISTPIQIKHPIKAQ